MSKILSVVFLAMLSWYVYTLLGQFHWLLALAAFVLAICNMGTVWMLRQHPRIVASICRRGVLKQYVRLVCYFIGEQLPLINSPRSSASELLVRSPREFQIAGFRAKQIVRGYDNVIDSAVARIYENLTLRRRRRAGTSPGPLASFLLVGSEGVGKRYFARVLAKLLYGNGDVEVFDCEHLTPVALIGTKDSPGKLLEIVGKQPHQMILFEHLDTASPDVVRLLSELLTTGKLRSVGADNDISFQNTTIAMTTTKGAAELAALEKESLGETAWQQRAIIEAAAEMPTCEPILGAVTALLFCNRPSDLVKAEVVALLMKKECTAHSIELVYVDPKIVATQVLQIDDARGFAHAPQTIRRLLRKPLLAAASAGHTSLSLRVRKLAQSRPVNRTQR